MMKYLRASFRMCAWCGVSAGLYLLWLVGLPVVFVVSADAERWRNWVFGAWARAAVQIMGMKVTVRNPAPEPPFLLVSNHLSYVDVILLQSQVNCTFIAKSEVAGWPIVGRLCRSMKTIFVDRNRKRDALRANTHIARAMTRASGVVLFAEGTSTKGETVLPFRSALLECAAKNQLPVHFASISYLTPADELSADRSICWWGKMTLPGHVFRLLQLSGFKASLVFGPAPVVAADRRELAVQLWSAVTAQFTPVVRSGEFVSGFDLRGSESNEQSGLSPLSE